MIWTLYCRSINTKQRLTQLPKPMPKPIIHYRKHTLRSHYIIIRFSERKCSNCEKWNSICNIQSTLLGASEWIEATRQQRWLRWTHSDQCNQRRFVRHITSKWQRFYVDTLANSCDLCRFLAILLITQFERRLQRLFLDQYENHA